MMAMIFALLYSSLAFSDTAKITVKVAMFPGGSFEVTSNEVVGSGLKKGDKYSAAELKVPVKSLVTGIDLRDTHMRERLREKEFPFITAKNIDAKDGTGTATITIAGVTQKLDFKFKNADNQTAEATFKIKLSDFKISEISYLGVGIEDEIEVIANVGYQPG